MAPLHRIGIWLALTLLAIAGAAPVRAADLATEVVVLKHRTAEQLLPLLQPLVPKPGTVHGIGNELVLQTTRTHLAELRKTIAALDRAPKRLLVTVVHDADTLRSGAGQAVYGTRSIDAGQAAQRVQVLEGSEASIRLGRSVPVVLRGAQRRVVGGRVIDDAAPVVEYRDVLSGFTVRARLVGDSVVVDVSPQRDTPGNQGPGSIDVQRVATTVSGRLGEWIEVGAVLTGQPARADAATYGTRSVSGESRRILVMVETVD